VHFFESQTYTGPLPLQLFVVPSKIFCHVCPLGGLLSSCGATRFVRNNPESFLPFCGNRGFLFFFIPFFQSSIPPLLRPALCKAGFIWRARKGLFFNASYSFPFFKKFCQHDLVPRATATTGELDFDLPFGRFCCLLDLSLIFLAPGTRKFFFRGIPPLFPLRIQNMKVPSFSLRRWPSNRFWFPSFFVFQVLRVRPFSCAHHSLFIKPL